MKPEYANTFGIRKIANSSGDILEVTLDASYKYMETAITARMGGVVATIEVKEGDTVKGGQLLLTIK